MKEYRVGIHYQEGAVFRIYANSSEQAKEKAREILDDSQVVFRSAYPDMGVHKIVHRETMVTDVEEMEDN